MDFTEEMMLRIEALEKQIASLHASHHELRNKFNIHAIEGQTNREKLDVLWEWYEDELS